MKTMPVTDNLSPSQSVALHSLFRNYAPRFLGAASINRTERLAWASDIVLRPLVSFAELRSDEASRLIDFMKRALGQEVTPAQRFYRRPGVRPDRDQARAYGTAGRRDTASNEIRLVDAPTLELLDRLVSQLGWTRARLDAFLHSKSSPVPGGAIRTLPQANRVIWALNFLINLNSLSRESARKADLNDKVW
jgi:hypothetical protein